MLHPVTYVNKLLLYSKDKIVLVNISAAKVLYDFPRLRQQLVDSQTEIHCV